MKNIPWNQIYNSGKTYTAFNQVLFDKIFVNLPPIKVALDIGCGRGELVFQLTTKGVDSTGIDSSEVAIEYAKGHVKNAKFVVSDLESFESSPYDLITCKLVLPFVSDKQQFLQKATSLLSPSGTFLLYTPVRHKDYEYSEHYERISIDYDDLNNLLNTNFSEVIEVEKLYRDNNETTIIFLCKK